MNRLDFLDSAMHSFAVAATSGLPPGQARGAAEMAPLVHGAEKAVQAYSRASDAYASFGSSVALWALLIAGVGVLCEWLLARGGPGR